jgi:hypothetical protein
MNTNSSPDDAVQGKPLSEAAKRALSEAAERRKKAATGNSKNPREFKGPQGLEPTRYGDWERKGIVSDF